MGIEIEMKQTTFNIDYTFCPKGHAWIFIPSSTLYSDLFWCSKCDCFYEPRIGVVKKESIKKQFVSDRVNDLINRAKFLDWKSKLEYNDMPPLPA